MKPEIMDDPTLDAGVTRQFHRDLGRIHRMTGNWNAIIERLQVDPGIRSLMDVGCGQGELLGHVREKLRIFELIGVDLVVSHPRCDEIPVMRADATRDPLPRADAAVSVVVLHHLTDEQVVDMIRNVGRYVKRFICLDLVRHPLPLLMFSLFICPFVKRIAAVDGRQSIRRSFRPDELRALVHRATDGTGATFDHWVSPYFAKQIIDIRWQ